MHKLKQICAWLKESRHALHLVGEVVVTYVATIVLGLIAAVGIEIKQGFKGDWQDDLLADGIGIAIGQLAQLLVIGLLGWQVWFATLFILSLVLMSGVVKFIPALAPHRKSIGWVGAVLGVVAFVGIVATGA
jgi:hypothetical protein